ncbi:hypothetical protein C923_03185 [Plasmodium falciparum UGT5.1]|uniref:Uncharacterized protein n=1 Tax=Plasmodium falciparum UGT5.1 TaxID=1237627 RepID=W7JM87_PLAFA|nr:hypothetical protein C923_03185 [Plasmodium falciparum UGT5.1]
MRININTKCMGRSTTSNVHAILGTNFWVQREPKHGYIKHRWNHVTPLVISPLRGEPNKTTINFQKIGKNVQKKYHFDHQILTMHVINEMYDKIWNQNFVMTCSDVVYIILCANNKDVFWSKMKAKIWVTKKW